MKYETFDWKKSYMNFFLFLLKFLFHSTISVNAIANPFSRKNLSDFIHEELTSVGAEKLALGSGESEIAPNVKKYRIRHGGYFSWPLMSKDVLDKFTSWCSDNSGKSSQSRTNDEKIALAYFATFNGGRWVFRNNFDEVTCKTPSESYSLLVEERNTNGEGSERFFYVFESTAAIKNAIIKGNAFRENANADSKSYEQCLSKTRENAIGQISIGKRLFDGTLVIDKKVSLLQIQDNYNQTQWVPVAEIKNYQLFDTSTCAK